MDVAKKIKLVLVEEDLNINSLAIKLNTSHQNLSAKFRRNNFSVKEMEDIAAALNYELKIDFIKKE